MPFPALYELAKTKQHRKPRKTATNTIVCLTFWNYFSGRNVWSMVIAKEVQQNLTCSSCPRLALALSAYFPHQTAVTSFQVYWTFSSSPPNHLNLSPPFNLFFFSSPTIPSQIIFFPSFLSENLYPIYLIILCNSMPNTLSFSHWLYVLEKTKWSVLALTNCTFHGMKNATVLVLRKMPPISGLCAHKAGKPTFLREQHLTPTSLLV